MVSLLPSIWAVCIGFLIKLLAAQQSYDNNECYIDSEILASNYLCSSNRKICQTFIVYRAQQNFQTISSISSLFKSNRSQLLDLNNLNESTAQNLQLSQEILLPVNCSCFNQFSQFVLQYTSSVPDTYSSIACKTFEGLLKVQTIAAQNPYQEGKIPAGSVVSIPIKCACPGRFESENDVKYLVTYPVVRGDEMQTIALKFNVSQGMIWAANGLGPNPTIFPQTTLLIPVKEVPVLNFISLPSPVNPSPYPQIVISPTEGASNMSSNRRKMYILLGAGALTAILLSIVAAALFTYIRKRRQQSFEPSSGRSSQMSNLSPDFLDGMSKLKHPLFDYSLEEMKSATEDFSEASRMTNSVYKGRIGAAYVTIEQMNMDKAHRVIEILTKINHVNIVKLYGCCFISRPYLVFEVMAKSCLRDCLSNQVTAKEFTWPRRMQTAFDITMGLHYIHCCTKPSYVHGNINSTNILITVDWRAKISGFELAKPFSQVKNKEKDGDNYDRMIVGRKGYLAPEYLYHGLSSPKVDVFALGIVLLELISGKRETDDCVLKESVWFLADGGLEGSSHCLEKLKEFMDPCLVKDCPLGDALCLALLAKACVEEDPFHRPTTDCVLKALSRMI